LKHFEKEEDEDEPEEDEELRGMISIAQNLHILRCPSGGVFIDSDREHELQYR
jgi:hypothetical protein